MSYCVNCGVELDETASFCPLCHTPVYNPNQPVNEASTKNPFPPSARRFPLLEAAHRHPDLHRSGLCGRVLWDLESLSQNPAHLVSLCDRRSDYAVDLDRAPFAPPQKGYLSSTATGRCPCHRRLCLPSSQWIWMDGIGTCTWRAHHSPAGCLVPVLGIDYGAAKTEHPILHRIGDRLLRGVYVGGRGAD